MMPTAQEYSTEQEWLEACSKWSDKEGATPASWAFYFAMELGVRNGWERFNYKRTEAEADMLLAFEHGKETLPLHTRNGVSWPTNAALPANWRDTLYIRKDELRDWIREYHPFLLESALLTVNDAKPRQPNTAPAKDESNQAHGAERNEELRTYHAGRVRAGSNKATLETSIKFGISDSRVRSILRNKPSALASGLIAVSSARSKKKP